MAPGSPSRPLCLPACRRDAIRGFLIDFGIAKALDPTTPASGPIIYMSSASDPRASGTGTTR
ncbi:hypothetical protein GCM10009556_002910 [Acrocarpospora pleiomorpha]